MSEHPLNQPKVRRSNLTLWNTIGCRKQVHDEKMVIFDAGIDTSELSEGQFEETTRFRQLYTLSPISSAGEPISIVVWAGNNRLSSSTCSYWRTKMSGGHNGSGFMSRQTHEEAQSYNMGCCPASRSELSSSLCMLCTSLFWVPLLQIYKHIGLSRGLGCTADPEYRPRKSASRHLNLHVSSASFLDVLLIPRQIMLRTWYCTVHA